MLYCNLLFFFFFFLPFSRNWDSLFRTIKAFIWSVSRLHLLTVLLLLSAEFVFSVGAEMLLYICSKSVNHDCIKLKEAGWTTQVLHVTSIIHTPDKVFLKAKEKRDSLRWDLNHRNKQKLKYIPSIYKKTCSQSAAFRGKTKFLHVIFRAGAIKVLKCLRTGTVDLRFVFKGHIIQLLTIY